MESRVFFCIFCEGRGFGIFGVDWLGFKGRRILDGFSFYLLWFEGSVWVIFILERVIFLRWLWFRWGVGSSGGEFVIFVFIYLEIVIYSCFRILDFGW